MPSLTVNSDIFYFLTVSQYLIKKHCRFGFSAYSVGFVIDFYVTPELLCNISLLHFYFNAISHRNQYEF